MDTKDILKASQSTQRLINDENYYKYIFKKTERVVSVVFYIVHHLEDSDRNKPIVEDIELVARELHNAVLQSLQSRAHVADEAVQETIQALVVLESKLRVAQATSVLAPEVLAVIFNETDSVLRAIAKYAEDENTFIESTLGEPALQPARSSTPRRQPRVSAPSQPGAPTATPTGGSSEQSDRRARIKTVIEAKGEVSIKDISEIITDVSEKTIQRELNAMIEDNELKRIGERRWSRYTLF